MQLFLIILVQYAIHLIDLIIYGIMVHGRTHHSQRFKSNRQVILQMVSFVGYMMFMLCVLASYDAVMIEEGMELLVFVVVGLSFAFWTHKRKNMIVETIKKWDAKGALDWIWGGGQ